MRPNPKPEAKLTFAHASPFTSLCLLSQAYPLPPPCYPSTRPLRDFSAFGDRVKELAMPLRMLGILLLAGAMLHSRAAPAAEIPPWLPKYDLDIRLDIEGHEAHVIEKV